jgi:hypothetical protein
MMVPEGAPADAMQKERLFAKTGASESASKCVLSE